MNRTYQAKNRTFQRSPYSKNKLSSFKPTTRRPRFNKRFIPRNGNRNNRLQRVQNAINYSKNYQRPFQQRSFNANNNSSTNDNNSNVTNRNNNREIYVKNLPRYVNEKMLFNLFRNEGRIIYSKVLYDNVGFSKGVGRILFMNFKDAMNAIKKWNNTEYNGNMLRVEYKAVQNTENRNNDYNKFSNNNSGNNTNSTNNGNNKGNRRNNNANFRQFNFNQVNHYGNKFNSNNNYNNNRYYNNGYRNFRRPFRNNVNY